VKGSGLGQKHEVAIFNAKPNPKSNSVNNSSMEKKL
jgi:hypothetical protein